MTFHEASPARSGAPGHKTAKSTGGNGLKTTGGNGLKAAGTNGSKASGGNGSKIAAGGNGLKAAGANGSKASGSNGSRIAAGGNGTSPQRTVLQGPGSAVQADHSRITRQIQALERAVLAFQPKAVGATRGRAAVDTNLAIVLSARLSMAWNRIGGSFRKES